MKIIVLSAISTCFLSAVALSNQGAVETQLASNRENTLNINIVGPAAQDISSQLSKNGVGIRRDPFSGALVQAGNRIRCIKQGDRPLYCNITLVADTVQ